MLNKFKSIFQNHQLLSVFTITILNRLLVVLIGTSLLSGGLSFSLDKINESFTSWDGLHYLDVANEGYDSTYPTESPEDSLCNQGLGTCQRNFAFFPVFPYLVKIISDVIDVNPQTVGIALSNFLFALSSVLLFLIVKKQFSLKVAVYSWLAMILFPVNYLFSGFLTESTFLFLLLLTFYLALEKKWLLAGLTGALLSATRNTGILIIFSLLLIFLEQNDLFRKFSFKRLLKSLKPSIVFALVFSAVGLIGFMLFLNLHVGDPLAFINIQEYWGKPVNGISPILAIPYSIVNYALEGSLKIHLYNLAYFAVFIGLMIWGILKKKIPYSFSFVMLWILVPLLSGSMLALPRYISVLFPMYILIGLLVSKNKWIRAIYFISASILSLIVLNWYISDLWITV